MLHHREADQHHDQHQAAEQRRADDVVGDRAADRHAGGDDPDHQQEPGRDQQHRAVEAVGRQIDDQPEAGEGDQHQRDAGDAGSHRGIEQRQRHQRSQKQQPGQRDVRIAHMPSVEIEIGEQEHQQSCRQHRFAGGAPNALGALRHVEHLAPESEVDTDIDQHGPGQSRGGREHDAALDHEQDGQHQRQQAGNADHDALVQRERVDLVLVGFRLPQIELRQLVGAQLGNEGDDRAGIQCHAEDIGGGRVLSLRAVAGGGRDGGDARHAEIRPQQAARDDAVMRRHDQAVELVVGIVGEREYDPVLAGLAGAHFDAADDTVRARRRGDLDTVGLVLLVFEDRGEVDRRRVRADADGVNGMCLRGGNDNHEAERERRKPPDQTQCHYSAVAEQPGRPS